MSAVVRLCVLVEEEEDEEKEVEEVEEVDEGRTKV